MDPNWGLDLGFPDASQAIGFLGFPMFLHRVSQELTIAGLLKYPYTLVAMAIDDDKELDRRKGLGFGSGFMAQLCGALGAAIRNQPTEIRSEIDVVARYEDLFLFSFPNTDFNQAMAPMRRIIDITRKGAGEAVGDEGYLIPISCGMLTWEPISGPIEPADLVYRAIEALYQAKKDTTNRLYLYRLGLKDENPERLRIKHNQTAPLRLKARPADVGGLLGAAQDADRAERTGPGAKPKKRKKKPKPALAPAKKKKKGPFWKFW